MCSAFPHGIIEQSQDHGLTKRELFAAMSMQGMLANGSIDFYTFNCTAIDAVSAAEALIKALNNNMGEK